MGKQPVAPPALPGKGILWCRAGLIEIHNIGWFRGWGDRRMPLRQQSRYQVVTITGGEVKVRHLLRRVDERPLDFRYRSGPEETVQVCGKPVALASYGMTATAGAPSKQSRAGQHRW